MNDFAFAYPPLNLTGVIKQFPMDFQVTEVMGFEPTGTGEHVFLWIRKQQCNTNDVAVKLARCAGVPLHFVGYAGRKDKQAVTSQWFSVYLEKHPEPDWHEIENDNIEIHTITRHQKKCRIGIHQGNQFDICIRDIDLSNGDWEGRLNHIKNQGFPNYFASQRFGNDDSNLELAHKYFANPKSVRSPFLKSTALSAARSYLFNQILSARIQQSTWNRILPGDVAMFKDGHSVFTAAEEDCARMDVIACGSLFGAGNALQKEAPAALEQTVLADQSIFTEGLLKADLKRQWRSLIEYPENLTWYVQSPTCLRLEFGLRRGVFATALLRECFQPVHANHFAAGDSSNDTITFEE